jgi:hypothetical protein
MDSTVLCIRFFKLADDKGRNTPGAANPDKQDRRGVLELCRYRAAAELAGVGTNSDAPNRFAGNFAGERPVFGLGNLSNHRLTEGFKVAPEETNLRPSGYDLDGHNDVSVAATDRSF